MPNLDCNNATSLHNLRNRSDSQIPPENRPLDAGSIHRYIIPLLTRPLTQYPEGESLLKSSPFSSYKTVQATRTGERLIITPEILSDPGLGMDLQVINPNYRGKRYTFVYTTAGYMSTTFSPFANGIAKLNLETKVVTQWKVRPGCVPSEPVFVPAPETNESTEDDGILLTIVKMERAYEEDDFLVVVDAKSMTELGRAHLNSQVAGWYHATFFQG